MRQDSRTSIASIAALASLALHAVVLRGSLAVSRCDRPPATALDPSFALRGPVFVDAFAREPVVVADTASPWGDERPRLDVEGGLLDAPWTGDGSTPRGPLRDAVEGPRDNADRDVAREPGNRDYSDRMIGDLTPWPGDRDAHVEPWGRDHALGRDPVSRRGGPFDAPLDTSLGAARVATTLLCDTCGDEGHGAFVERGTQRGGATGTEAPPVPRPR